MHSNLLMMKIVVEKFLRFVLLLLAAAPQLVDFQQADLAQTALVVAQGYPDCSKASLAC